MLKIFLNEIFKRKFCTWWWLPKHFQPPGPVISLRYRTCHAPLPASGSANDSGDVINS